MKVANLTANRLFLLACAAWTIGLFQIPDGSNRYISLNIDVARVYAEDEGSDTNGSSSSDSGTPDDSGSGSETPSGGGESNDSSSTPSPDSGSSADSGSSGSSGGQGG
ncbi:MAG TPA: hypothetical protein PKM25_13475, partial [Candidatus Ozemobacteraceae bacterium]|nr:hypothetical protein [Candidatus Ozemobacteraceae bacterium]